MRVTKTKQFTFVFLLLAVFASTAKAAATEVLNDLHYLKLLSDQAEVSLHLYNNNRARPEYNLNVRQSIEQMNGTRENLLPSLDLAANEELKKAISQYTSSLELLTVKIEDKENVGDKALRQLNREHLSLGRTIKQISSRFSVEEPEQVKHARKGSDALVALNRFYVYASMPDDAQIPDISGYEVNKLVDEYMSSYTALKQDGSIDKKAMRELNKNWRFIRPSLTGERAASVPFVVNRFSNEMIEELVVISRQFE